MITVKHETNKTSSISYPCVGVYSGEASFLNGLIVLFIKKGTGVIVEEVKGHFSVGYYSNTWDMNQFILKDAVVSF